MDWQHRTSMLPIKMSDTEISSENHIYHKLRKFSSSICNDLKGGLQAVINPKDILLVSDIEGELAIAYALKCDQEDSPQQSEFGEAVYHRP